MQASNQADFICEEAIEPLLAATTEPDAARVRAIIAKARALSGLTLAEVATLTSVNNPEMLAEIATAAHDVKLTIYGKRMVLFAPLYISNRCANECSYCAFRASNHTLVRRTLTQPEIADETRILIGQGHKRILMVAGETAGGQAEFEYILNSINTIYETRVGTGEIRRVNVNLAPQSVENFSLLKQAGIGTFQLFQETYHRSTYAAVHTSGRKRDYDWRTTAFDRAIQAGIDDVGMGALFGLYDWRFELLAMMQQVEHLEARFGVGPHTISFPRIEPAAGSSLASNPPFAVSDRDFLKLVAIVRLAVPYTGLIMSTRESAAMRRETYALGISQLSAGSHTDPGSYGKAQGEFNSSQFQLGDHRTLDEVVHDLVQFGYTPSFCTACYRTGRTGADFMDLAKPGEIKQHCTPNALATFQEYLCDYATAPTRTAGEELIQLELQQMDPSLKRTALPMIEQVRAGARDVFL